MIHMNKTRLILEAAVAIAVAFALIIPGAAVVTNNEYKYAFPNSTPVDVVNTIRMQPMGHTLIGEDVLLSFSEGDDYFPHVTIDPEGNVVATWTNEPGVSEGQMAIVYSSNPTEPTSWDGWQLALSDPFSYYFDTAKIVGPDPTDFKGLMGVYMAIDTEQSGYYLIDDITADPVDWEFYTWNGGAPDPQYACIADMGFYQDLYYPEYYGPFNFYIYHEIYPPYDIVDCPICFHTDVRGGAGGVGFFDGQSFEKTAPSSDPDLVDLGDRFHTVIQYNNGTIGPQIVWKKIVPAEEPDYEFTPYQATLGPGESPAIAAYDTNVAVVYMDAGEVKCQYSSDDGETFSTVSIATGGYPDICAVESTFYAVYIDSGNLYLVESTDGGATWSSPEQVNDVAGTVYETANSVDIHEGGIVWMDTQNADFDIYYDELIELQQPPDIEIGTVSGGVGVTAEINNVGGGDATDVAWSINLNGGLILLGGEASGTIASIPAGGSTTISTGLVFGIGRPTITITAAEELAEKSAFVLLFLVLGL